MRKLSKEDVMLDKVELKLFSECLCALNSYKKYREQLGEFDRLTCVAHARFAALFSVIEESGLYDEYHDWTEEQEQ